MSATPIEEPKKKTSSRNTIIISVLAVIVVVQSIKIYLDYKDKVEITEQKVSVEQELGSTMQRLTEIQAELDQKIIEIQKLGGNVEELQKAKAEVDRELSRSNQRNSKSIKELKDRVEGYEELLKMKDEEIDKLKSVNKELYSENRTLKTTQNKLSDSINRLSSTKQELASKVAIASQLKAENVTVMAVNEKGKERESPFKNKQLQRLKVEFNLAENNVAPIEGKKIVVRVIDENGQVIFDVAKGSGPFIVNGKEEFYTASQEILFDNTKQKLTYYYEKGSDYASGNYTIEIYTDGYKMGSAQFTVR